MIKSNVFKKNGIYVSLIWSSTFLRNFQVIIFDEEKIGVKANWHNISLFWNSNFS